MRAARLLLTLLLGITCPAGAAEGYVRTRAGAVLEGMLRFGTNAVIITDVERVERAEVAAADIVEFVIFAGDDELVDARLPAGRVPEVPGESWIDDDIGEARFAGASQWSGATTRVRSSGTNALGTLDSCHFTFKPAGERFEIVARAARVRRTDPWARAGLMIREGTAAGARNFFVSVSAARGGVVSWRDRFGGESQVSLDANVAPGWWLKLKRDGDVLTAFKSRSGRQWTLVERVTLPMAKDCYAGLAVAGANGALVNEAVFERVEAGVFLRNRWSVPQVELTSGSMKAGHVESMDDRSINFSTRYGAESLPLGSVAQIRFQPLPARAARELKSGRTGVLLASGEFIDGDCRSIEEGRLVLSSVPLGVMRYDIGSDVVVAVLRAGRDAAPAACEVRLVDGSVWRGSDLAISPLGVKLREPTLGWRWLPLSEIRELRQP